MHASKKSKAPARHGTAAVELAVLAPFLVFMMVIAVDWARVFYYTVTINDCARNGALYMYAPPAPRNSTPTTRKRRCGHRSFATPTVTSARTDAYGRWVE